MPKQCCPACYPNKVYSHRASWWGEVLEIFIERFFFAGGVQVQLPRWPRWFSITHFWYAAMAACRLIRFCPHLDKKDHYPRSWVVLEEGQKRKISLESITILGRVSTYYRARFGSKYYYYDAVPSRFLNFNLDDKNFVKIKLLKNGFPAAEGKMFWSALQAIHYGKKLGFPLVVKPTRGTHAYHVTAPVENEDALKKAIALAKQYQPRFIVERFLPHHLYRVTVVNFNHVFVARREAPNVTGDGTRTVRELIEMKNSDPRRGNTGQKDTTLHKISLEKTLATLERAGLTMSFVPAQGEKIILHNKISIGSGGDIIEETPLIHPENREMFRRAAHLFNTDLIGFDIIAEDLGRSYTEQSCGIIEANSIPMLDFHHHPFSGQPCNVAACLWDGVLADNRVRYIYPVKIRRSIIVRLIWHFFDVALPVVRDCLVKLRFVRMLHRRQRFPAGWLKPDITPEAVIAHLKMHGFEVTRPAWIDRGEIISLRKLLDHEKQCHIRVFNDGEVRAHVEYAPEVKPFAHLLEQGLQTAHEIVSHYLGHFLTLQPATNKVQNQGHR